MQGMVLLRCHRTRNSVMKLIGRPILTSNLAEIRSRHVDQWS